MHHWLAWVWLLALVIAVLAYVVNLLRRSDYGLWESCLFLPTYMMGRLLWRVHFTNAMPEEIRGGAVLVANHRSSVDPFFVQLAARRRVHWLVAKEYCQHFIFGAILKPLEVIPTNRSGMDTGATKMAIRLTQQGKLVGMFPEGALNHTQDPLIPVRSGAALVAIRAGVPIVPLLIEGSPYRRTVWSPVFMPANVRITFGNPIHPDAQKPPKQDGLEASHSDQTSDTMIIEWAREVLRLAGQQHFEVQLASRRRRR